MVKNFARSTGKKFPAINDPVTFRDQGQIASWAKESVALCQRADILNGDAESGRFRPGERATRAEAASIVYKYIENTEFDGTPSSKSASATWRCGRWFSPSTTTPPAWPLARTWWMAGRT